MAEIMLLNVRLAYGKGVFEKVQFAGDANGKADFNAKFILPPDHPQLEQLHKLEEQVAKEKWGEKATANLKVILAGDKGVVHDGATQRSDGFEDMLFISARNDTAPTAIDGQRKPVTKESGIIYSGCYVNVKLNLWAQDNKWGQRINAEMLGVQFAGDGDSFAAGSPPAKPDDFPELDAADAGGEDDPFA